MKKHFLYPIYLLLLILNGSCSNKPKVTNLITFTTNDQIPFPKDLLNIHYIPLETNENCLLSVISKVELFEDQLFIADPKDGNLFVFNIDGTFITQIGKRGGTPSEYISFKHFSIDKEKRRIGIFDAEAQKIVFYSLDSFEYISSMPVNLYAKNFEFLPNDQIIWFSPHGTEISKERSYFSLTDTRLNLIHSYYKTFFKSYLSLSLSNNFIYTLDKDIFIYHFWAPVIYQINEDTMEPHYEFDFPNHTFPPLDFFKQLSKDWNSFRDKLLQSEYINCWGVYETTNLICTMYAVNRTFFIGFYDKINAKAYWYPYDKLPENLGLEVTIEPINSTEKYVICITQASDLQAIDTDNTEISQIKNRLMKIAIRSFV